MEKPGKLAVLVTPESAVARGGFLGGGDLQPLALPHNADTDQMHLVFTVMILGEFSHICA